jgi:hypothetical protein
MIGCREQMLRSVGQQTKNEKERKIRLNILISAPKLFGQKQK